MCLLRRPAAAAVAHTARLVPRDLARDGVQHSWPSYRGALTALLRGNPLPEWIAEPGCPTTVVLGAFDQRTPAQDVLGWPHDGVETIVSQGDQLLPLTHVETIAALAVAGLNRRARDSAGAAGAW